MVNGTIQGGTPIAPPIRSIKDVFISEWKYWLAGALFSFLLASVLLSGWPQGILPNISYPFRYDGDGLSHAWIGQRAIEGWVNTNIRSGYPFGSSFLDYPGSDAANYLIIKFLGLLNGNFYAAINLYILLSFSAVFVASYCALAAIGLTRSFAFCASLLYAFIPFHFQRIPHLFYMWYFVAPLFFYSAIYLYNQACHATNRTLVQWLVLFLSFALLSSFGVYYALFGVLILGTTALIIISQSASIKKGLSCYVAIAAIITGVLLNVAPNIYNTLAHGKNSEVASRSPAESEVYGFKFMQLVLPRPDHRVPAFAHATNKYNSSYPLINENTTSTLGVVSSVGFMLCLIAFFRSAAGSKIDYRISVISIITVVLFLFGTIGGFGAVFSLIISASIRGWNRISIFIAFGSLTVLFTWLQITLSRYSLGHKRTIFITCLSLAIGILGIFDQTIPACVACNHNTKDSFEKDRLFVKEIESLLPPLSAIYQLPYMGFPEVPQKFKLHTYDLAAGFLHSENLRWSYGGMKGREGDLFFRRLSEESIATQLAVIKRLGFSGLYIDRRGFEDNANALIETLSVDLKMEPDLIRSDDQALFYKLDRSAIIDPSGLSFEQISKIAEYPMP